MKKLTVISIVAVLILSMGIVAFADSGKEAPQWYRDMIHWRKEQVNEAVTNGEISKEDAKYWNEEIDRMEEYHNEYGHGPGMMGRFNGMNSRKINENRFMRGFGPGSCHRW